jgi:hypothetical protein
MEAFSQKWFAMYYPLLGILVIAGGSALLISYKKFQQYLSNQANDERPPVAIRNILKYLLLFTIPCLVLSFLPFSWTELLFSFWSLLMVYVISLQLVRWKQTRVLIQEHPDKLEDYFRLAGAIMVAVGLVILLLGYLVIKRANIL